MSDAMFQAINLKLDAIEAMLKAIIQDGYGLSNCVTARAQEDYNRTMTDYLLSRPVIQPSDQQ